MDINKIKILTKELIKYKTVRPGINHGEAEFPTICFIKEINNCMKFVRSSLHKSIITDKAEKYIDDASCPVTIAKFHDNKEPDLLMVGHIDVVAGDDSQFNPYEKSGKIYGRGAKDMKSGVAAMLEIMNHYAEEKKKPNIAVAIVSDEEIGGYKGSNLIVNKMGYKPKFVISPDPGEKHCIINKEKGFLWFSIITHGKSCHPSRPWLGECAFQKAFKIWNDISDRFNLWQSENEWKTSASLLEINKIFQNEDGSYSPDHSSSLAGMVRCRIDIRFTENEDVDEIKSIIKRIVEKHGRGNRIEINNTGSVCFTLEKNKLLQQFRHIAEIVEGKKIPLGSSSGASDLRFFSERNIPCINYGPQGKNHHGKNEYVIVSSIMRFYKTVTEYINHYLLKQS